MNRKKLSQFKALIEEIVGQLNQNLEVSVLEIYRMSDIVSFDPKKETITTGLSIRHVVTGECIALDVELVGDITSDKLMGPVGILCRRQGWLSKEGKHKPEDRLGRRSP